MIPPLVRFGGWMTVSNIVSPLMVSMDRFLIGAILPMVAVAEYVTPYEVVTKIFLIPQAFLGVLFPALASAFVRDPRRAATLFERGVRTIALLVFPAVLTIVLFAHEGLQLWVGADFASASTSVLQILAVGVFINAALGQVGFTLLQGAARPDITARAHLIELPFYAAAIWWLTRQIGLPGVALTWTLRVSVDAAVLMYLSVRLAPVSRAEISRVAGTMFLSLAALAGAAAVHGLTVKCVYLGVTLAAFATLGWRRALTPGEREGLVAWLRAGGKPVAVGALGAD